MDAVRASWVSPSVRADRFLVLPGSVPEPLSASGGGTSRSVRPSETAPAGSADPTAVASRQSPVASRFGRPLSGRVGGAPVSCSGRSPGALLPPQGCRVASVAIHRRFVADPQAARCPLSGVKIAHRRRLPAIRYAGIFRSWWQAVCTGGPRDWPRTLANISSTPGSRPRPQAPDPARHETRFAPKTCLFTSRRLKTVFAPYHRVFHGGLTGSLTAQERRKGSPQ